MSRRLLVAVFVVLLTASGLAAFAQSAAGAPELSVRMSRIGISTSLGDKFTFRSTVVNQGPTAARGLIAHLNIFGLDSSVYVDPEDWSSNRTRYLETLRPGKSTTITWRMQAVNAGAFDVYVAVLPRRAIGRAPTTGQALRLAVADRRSLNSGGILPLALGVPSLLALLALGVRLRRGG
jgi:hypothetical protein